MARLSLALALSNLSLGMVAAPALAIETWEKLDKRLKSQVYELNVGLKIHLRDGMWAQIQDLSPKGHYPVFSTWKVDQGYRVVGNGSAFPVHTLLRDKTYFITNRHVIDSGVEIIKECERFFAAMRLYADQTAGANNVTSEAKYKELLQTVNLSTKGKNLAGNDRQLYETTVDAIWDAYDVNLSVKADPARILFQKYLKAAGLEIQSSYFLHAPGPRSQQPLEARVYKTAKAETDPDIAILSVPPISGTSMEFDTLSPSEGQEIQVIGYPKASDLIDADSDNYYAPTFSTGRISRVAPRMLQVDAPITNGNSGGPVVSLRGKVLGVVAVRAVVKGTELSNFGGAVTGQSVQSFAPELFGGH